MLLLEKAEDIIKQEIGSLVVENIFLKSEINKKDLEINKLRSELEAKIKE